jgi:hypothetical protein
MELRHNPRFWLHVIAHPKPASPDAANPADAFLPFLVRTRNSLSARPPDQPGYDFAGLKARDFDFFGINLPFPI